MTAQLELLALEQAEWELADRRCPRAVARPAGLSTLDRDERCAFYHGIMCDLPIPPTAQQCIIDHIELYEAGALVDLLIEIGGQK